MSTVIDGTWDDLAADYLGYLAHGRATIRTVATPGDSRYAWLDPHRGWRLVDKSSLHQSIAAWRDTLVASPPEPTGDDKTDEKARRYWVDVCRRLSDAAGKNHLLEALAAVQRPVDVEDADRPGRIGFSNGVLDVRRWLAGDPTAFEPWSHLSPFLLRNTGYPWQPADEETLDDLRTGWLDTSIVDENGAPDRDTQTMLLSQIARAMLGERQPAALVWLLGHDDPGITELLPTGTNGSNGKSLFLKLVGLAAGMSTTGQPGYADGLNSRMLLSPSGSHANSSADYHVAMLQDLRLAITDDAGVTGVVLDDNTIKQLTGSAAMNARHPGGRPFTFAAKFLPLVSSNEQPALRSVNWAVRRRLMPVLFRSVWLNPAPYAAFQATCASKTDLLGYTTVPARVQALVHKIDDAVVDRWLANPSAILQLILEVWRDAGQPDTITLSAASEEALNRWCADENRIAAFLSETVVYAPGETIKHSATDPNTITLYSAYATWCRANGYTPINARNLVSAAGKEQVVDENGQPAPMTTTVRHNAVWWADVRFNSAFAAQHIAAA